MRPEPAGASLAASAGAVRERPVPGPRTEPGPTRPATVYLEEDDLEFLRQVRLTALGGQPRADVSMSAVVRLALRRLRSETAAAQVRDYLVAQPTDPRRPGRKRR